MGNQPYAVQIQAGAEFLFSNIAQEISVGSTPQYGAVVFDDDVGARIADAVQRGLNITAQARGSRPGDSTPDAFALIIQLLGASPEGR